jgi:hypothetical protein
MNENQTQPVEDLTQIPGDVFYNHIYKKVAKEFLIGNDYNTFADMLRKKFILTYDQWDEVVRSWEEKETILADYINIEL